MQNADHSCPHCGSQNNRTLADHLGKVGWCGDCHRAWIPEPRWQACRKAPRTPPPERERRVA